MSTLLDFTGLSQIITPDSWVMLLQFYVCSKFFLTYYSPFLLGCFYFVGNLFSIVKSFYLLVVYDQGCQTDLRVKPVPIDHQTGVSGRLFYGQGYQVGADFIIG